MLNYQIYFQWIDSTDDSILMHDYLNLSSSYPDDIFSE
jgi:hypothetical protein